HAHRPGQSSLPIVEAPALPPDERGLALRPLDGEGEEAVQLARPVDVSHCHATRSLRPGSKSMVDAYSMCRTRRGAGSADLDEAWTINGRMARIPPRSTVHSHAVWRATTS